MRLRAATATITIALVLGLSSCTGTPGQSSSSRAPEPTSSPSTGAPSPAPASAPPTRVDAECEDFVDSIADVLGAELSPVSTIPTLQGRGSWLPGPPQFAFAQWGALYCEYGGDLASHDPRAMLMIVPDAQDYADGSAYDLDPPTSECSAEDSGAICGARGLFGASYVELSAGHVPSAGAHDRFAAAFAAVAERAASTGSRAEGVAKGLECAALLPARELSALAGTDFEIMHPDEGPMSMEAWLPFEVLGVPPCFYWKDTGEGDLDGLYHGVLSQLPDGAWAYRQSVDGVPLDVPEGAEGSLDCEVSPYGGCAVDVLRGDDWRRYLIFEAPSSEAATIALATEIATLLAR